MLRKITVTQALIDEAASYAIQTIFENGIVIGTGPWTSAQAEALSWNCPVARAFNATFPGEHFQIKAYKAVSEVHAFELDDSVWYKVTNYDKGEGMKPFECEVEVQNA